MIDPSGWSLFQSISMFLACTLAIGVFGTWITGVVDQLADRTGIGEAWVPGSGTMENRKAGHEDHEEGTKDTKEKPEIP